MIRLIVVACLFLSVSLFGQQLPQFTQFSNNISLVNNANFVHESNSINLGIRSQMLGFGLEPNSAFIFGKYGIKKKIIPNYNPQFRISKPIPEVKAKTSRFDQAVAAIILADRYGAFNRTHISGIYNFGFQLNPKWNISAALKIGLSSLGFNSENAMVLNPNDPYANYVSGDLEYDEFVSGNNRSTVIDVGSSVYVSSKSFKAGVSVDQIARNALSFSSSPINFNQKLHYNILLGYSFFLNEKINLEIIGLLKQMNPAPISVDLTTRATFSNRFWTGINYRHNSAVGFIAGMKLGKSFRMGYSYDLITNRLNLFSSGGHEIILSYAF
jgi:type IX secretion system PorP/SprF family membrane protein